MKVRNSSQHSVDSKQGKLKTLTTDYGLPSADNNGFTLIEILLIIIVVSIAIPTLLILVGGEAGRGVESEIRVTATNVAKQLMEEIKAKCWDEAVAASALCGETSTPSATLGPDGEATRAAYNDVDDFNDVDPAAAGCTDTFTVNNVSFTRAVDVCYVSAGDLNTCLGGPKSAGCTWTGATPTDYKKITVTVTAPGTNWGSSVVMTTVVTNY